MFSKKKLFIILILVLGGGVFYAVHSSSTQKDPQNKYEQILQLVGEMLEEGHFAPKKIDDNFSKEVFKKYLTTLDPEKIYFFYSDIEKFKKIETKIDDEIKGDKLESFYVINEIYKKRVAEVAELYKVLLKDAYDFNIQEQYKERSENASYPNNEAARKELWRVKLTKQCTE